MENKSHALAAGLFTIAMLIAAVLAGLWFNRDRIEYVPYQIATKQSIPGLNPQAAVRYRGLDVGKVDDISFDPKVVGQILVHISVRPDTPITRSTFATLGYQGVTGIAYIQLDDDGSQRVKLESAPDNVARIEMRPSLFDQLQNRGLAILQQTEEVAKRINNLLQPANQEKILAAFDAIGNAADQLEAIPRQLQPTLQRMPALTAQAQQTLGTINTLSRDASGLVNNLDRLSTSLQQPTGPIASITHSVDRVGMLAERLEYDLAPLTSDLGVTLRSLTRTLDNLNDRPQSILFGGARAQPGPGEDGFNDD